MTTIIIFSIAIILFVVFVLPVFKKSVGENKKEYLPYVKKDFLMTKAEHEFFKVLQEIIKDKYYIIPQVQLSDIVQVEKYEKQKQTYRNKIDRKSVDFVLFNKEYFTPHLVIELDDSTHLREDRQARDSFLNNLLNKVGLKIIHIKTESGYDYKEISDKISLYDKQ
jgi:very-short-patch-repair endonuclease